MGSGEGGSRLGVLVGECYSAVTEQALLRPAICHLRGTHLAPNWHPESVLNGPVHLDLDGFRRTQEPPDGVRHAAGAAVGQHERRPEAQDSGTEVAPIWHC